MEDSLCISQIKNAQKQRLKEEAPVFFSGGHLKKDQPRWRSESISSHFNSCDTKLYPERMDAVKKKYLKCYLVPRPQNCIRTSDD